MNDADSHFMTLALREARKGIGLTSPNPPVGAVIEGAFLLHGVRKHVSATVRLRVTEHDGSTSVHLETIEPLRVGLSDYGVAPRSSFGELAMKGLEALAPEVSAFAEVSLVLDFVSSP